MNKCLFHLVTQVLATVRDWLASKDYAFQFDFGKEKLEEYGKLTRTDNKWIFKVSAF